MLLHVDKINLQDAVRNQANLMEQELLKMPVTRQNDQPAKTEKAGLKSGTHTWMHLALVS